MMHELVLSNKENKGREREREKKVVCVKILKQIGI